MLHFCPEFPRYAKISHARANKSLGRHSQERASWQGHLFLDRARRAIMEKLQGTVPMLRKAAIITLIGFLVITTAGPLLTIAGVLLPFAVVGLLVWMPFKGIMMWKQGGWTALGGSMKRGLGRVVAAPVWLLGRAFGAVGWLLGSVFGLVGFVLGLILPVVLGAVGGGVLCAIRGFEHQDAEFRVP